MTAKLFLRLMTACVVAAAATLVGGCAAVGVHGTICHVSANNVHESTGSSGWMDAKVQIWCEGTDAPESITGVIKLQKKIRGVWRDVPRTENEQTYTNIRLGKKNKYVVMTRERLCEAGTFRAAARGWGELGGRQAGTLKWKYGNAITDPCD
jgi:hypothetical protein